MKKALCIMSGGMDSTLSAYMMAQEGYEIIALHFNYDQRTQKRELSAFHDVADALKVKERYVIDLGFFADIGASALTDKTIEVPVDGIEEGIPVTYVPFRNGIFLSIASAIAEKEGAERISIGVVEEDSSGYPDCREVFYQQFERAIEAGTRPETNISIKTPLIRLNKAAIVTRGLSLSVPFHLTWSCYTESVSACGECESCRLRLRGFAAAGETDPINYQTS